MTKHEETAKRVEKIVDFEAELKSEQQECDRLRRLCFNSDAEIARLKAENLRLSHEGLLVEKQAAEAERDYFRSRLAEAERERDAAEAKGMRMGLERAREIVATGNIDQLSDAIDAEIAKTGGK